MSEAKNKTTAKPRKITPAERKKSELAENKIKKEFTGDEIRSLAEAMAERSVSIKELEDEKSTVAAQYKARIETARSEMQEAANRITAGYEIVKRECLVVYNPGKAMKDLFNPANGEFIASVPMEEPDFQRELRLSKDKANAQKKAAPGNPTPDKKPNGKAGEPAMSKEAQAAKKDAKK